MSVLGTLTPLGERSRNGSYRVTATLYVASSGLAAGGVAVLLELVVAGLSELRPVGTFPVMAIAATLGITALAVDATGRTDRLPHFRLQVPDEWLGRLRPSVYAIGFGVQLGSAFTTH